MPLLGTIANSPYSQCLKASGNQEFDFAPYPPVLKSSFDIATVYSVANTGHIDTVDNIPPIYANERAAYVRTDDKISYRLDTNIPKWSSIPLNPDGETDLSAYQIVTPFRPQPGSADTALEIFFAPANTEAAFLLPGPWCKKSYFLPQFYDNSQWWQMVKQILFDGGRSKIYLVTEVLCTNRWACEYRTAELRNNAYYAVNQKDGHYNPAFSDLQMHHGSMSGSVWTSPLNETQPYTVLASCRPVERRGIGGYGPWAVRFQNAFKLRGKSFRFNKNAPANNGGSQELTTFNSTFSGTQVTRLHLGSTLYLLEIQEQGGSLYALEAEGHQEDYPWDTLFSSLDGYAKQYRSSDWRDALALMFPAGDLQMAPTAQGQFGFQPAPMQTAQYTGDCQSWNLNGNYNSATTTATTASLYYGGYGL